MKNIKFSKFEITVTVNYGFKKEFIKQNVLKKFNFSKFSVKNIGINLNVQSYCTLVITQIELKFRNFPKYDKTCCFR